MKSEKAEAFLSRVNDSAELFEPEESVVPYLDAVSAVEQAEAERDAKAVEAHRRCCSVRDHNENYCLLYVAPCSDGCDYMKGFIQELNKE